MIVDSSAIVAILGGEPEATRFATAIHSDPSPKISAVNWLEVAMVADSRTRPELQGTFDALMEGLPIEIVPFDATQARMARQANLDFGRNRHKAALNYGDCMAYALAKVAGEPLLFKGNDFIHTDITPALA